MIELQTWVLFFLYRFYTSVKQLNSRFGQNGHHGLDQLTRVTTGHRKLVNLSTLNSHSSESLVGAMLDNNIIQRL